MRTPQVGDVYQFNSAARPMSATVVGIDENSRTATIRFDMLFGFRSGPRDCLFDALIALGDFISPRHQIGA